MAEWFNFIVCTTLAIWNVIGIGRSTYLKNRITNQYETKDMHSTEEKKQKLMLFYLLLISFSVLLAFCIRSLFNELLYAMPLMTRLLLSGTLVNIFLITLIIRFYACDICCQYSYEKGFVAQNIKVNWEQVLGYTAKGQTIIVYFESGSGMRKSVKIWSHDKRLELIERLDEASRNKYISGTFCHS